MRYVHLVGKKPKPNAFEVALSELRKVVPSDVPLTAFSPAKTKHQTRIVTAEFLWQNADSSWAWEEPNGGLHGVFSPEFIAQCGQVHEADTVRVQVDVTPTACTVVQVVAGSYRTLGEKERRERTRELRRRHAAPPPPKKITHHDASPPPGVRRVVKATVTVVEKKRIKWRAINGNETMASATTRAGEVAVGQIINVVLEERSGSLHFVDFVTHTLTPREEQAPASLGELSIDAMYTLEPGDIVDAFLEFTGTPGQQDSGRDGKTRPAVFIAKRGTTMLLRGLTDGESSYGQRSGNQAIRDWQEAGLAKPSVVQSFDQEVDVVDVRVKRGRPSSYDRRALNLR